MEKNHYKCRLIAALLLVLPGYTAIAQNIDYEPQVGQVGKDVVWVPTPQVLVDKMLEMAKVTPSDFVIDLGSGDGRTVITAARLGANALGVEYNPEMVELSNENAIREGVSGRAKFVQADLFETDLSRATVITMFLLQSINLRLRPTLLNLKPGTRIVSNTFTMQEWEPDQTYRVEGNCTSWCTALLWIVPAKVNGTWKYDNGMLEINQEFQKFTGTMTSGRDKIQIVNGRLNGDQISFDAGGVTYKGKVNGDSMSGTYMKSGSTRTWSAKFSGS
jgi:hypothetical protein